ncbi:cathepsin G-like isoform X2 [Diachasmimorpha longicaudata]|uniref:cathepsin G-like isoform X2 n=1 Tax=Diachasmimorpha longicaudata TaxID=58733 RepID=UPI0030B908F9
MFLTLSSDVYGIYGGDRAVLGQFKHSAVLWCNDIICCGGGLIDLSHVLTAAHCVADLTEDDLVVMVGQVNVRLVMGQYLSAVSKIIIHPEYHLPLNDIAVLKLRDTFIQDDRVAPIGIPYTPIKDYTAKCEMSGWGSISAGVIRGPGFLKWAPFTLKTPEQCKRQRLEIAPNQVCAYDPFMEHGIAKGDSGNLLVCNNIAVAILSETPHRVGNGFYLMIYPYLGFINNAIRCVV